MARADLLVKLVKSGHKGDKELFTKTVEAIIAEESDKRHSIVAGQLREVLRDHSINKSIMTFGHKVENLVFEQLPTKTLEDLVLDRHVRTVCNEVIEEQHRADILRAHNLEPRNRILLVGPPGNGKTSLAEAVANALMVPFLSVSYEGIIGSFLGETASKLKNLFDFIKTQRCVVFFDEFDAIGKERGDTHETGEIKRVVSSLLMQIDKLPSYVVVIAATNHPELLDKAVWRRFQSRLDLDKPKIEEIKLYLKKFSKTLDKSSEKIFLNLAPELIGLTFSEIEDFVLDILRRKVLSTPSLSLNKIISERLIHLKKKYTQKVRTANIK